MSSVLEPGAVMEWAVDPDRALLVVLLERTSLGDGTNWRALILVDRDNPASEGRTDLIRPGAPGWKRVA